MFGTETFSTNFRAPESLGVTSPPPPSANAVGANVSVAAQAAARAKWLRDNVYPLGDFGRGLPQPSWPPRLVPVTTFRRRELIGGDGGDSDPRGGRGPDEPGDL